MFRKNGYKTQDIGPMM